MRQGNLKYFLAMEIHRDRLNNKIWLTQENYTRKLLSRFNMLECRGRKLPLSPSVLNELVKPGEEEILSAKDLPYRELTGSLQYLATMTRPDIVFAVNRLSSSNSGWSTWHFELCKGILRYISATRNFGLRLGGSASGLKAYVDSDFNADVRDYKSTTGWAVILNEGTIAWRSRKQPIVAHSTAEAEYIAADDVAKDIVWERRMLKALDGPSHTIGPTPTYIDNKAAITIGKNNTSHDSTKHINYRMHYLRDLIATKIIEPIYIATDDNPADIFTKPVNVDKFEKHRKSLGIEPRPA